ncbi:MAG: PilZ domain-containing protein [Lachnospiraceae bacterium]|nr:PilZ domain-containing protein [Lachnospiraceae bacterium]
MYIYELESGSQVHIDVIVKGKKMEFDTTVTGSAPEIKSIKCEPIVINGKVLGFSRASVKVTATNSSDHRKYVFQIEKTANKRADGQLYLYCADDIKPVNNRESFRVPCGYRASIQVGDTKRKVESTVHDISYSGAALLIKKSARIIPVGSKISISIHDEDETEYKITGAIVRTVEDYTQDSSLLGVQFTEQVPAIISLVARLNVKAARVRGEH